MKIISIPKSFLLILMSLFTISLLSACGGSSDSSSGTGSFAAGSATITGNVSDGVAYQRPAEPTTTILASVYEVIVPNAHASGVSGVNVELFLDGVKIMDQTTDGGGNFSFSDLAPGNYTLQIVQNGRVTGKSPVIQLDANTETRIGMGVNGGLHGLEVEARNTTISGEVEDHNSNDDDQKSNDNDDDQNSNDDDDDDDQDDDNDCNDSSCDDDDSKDKR